MSGSDELTKWLCGFGEDLALSENNWIDCKAMFYGAAFIAVLFEPTEF